ncbi:MAG TPA: cadherin domain-containing protein, partial [Thermoanaerobaculia bacterium]
MNTKRRFAASTFALVFAIVFPMMATAATSEFSVLMNVDPTANPVTGCTVTEEGQIMTGVDQILIATVTTDAGTGVGMVTSLVRRVCTNGAFGGPINVAPPSPPWGVGYNTTNGRVIVETAIPFSVLGGSLPESTQLGFIGRNGDSVHVAFHQGFNPVSYPYWTNGRTRAVRPFGVHNIVLDGDNADWGKIGELLPGIASGGTNVLRIHKVFAYGSDTHFFFQFDARVNDSAPNQAPTVTNDTFSIAENTPNGTQVNPGDPVQFNDPDIGQNHTFSIVAGDPNNIFSIDNNGIITVQDSSFLDFETQPATYNLTVRVIDDGSPQESGDATITIHITNVNEEPFITNQSFHVAENSPLGTNVQPGPVTATDPDGNTLSYAIIGGNTGNAFTINAATGQISVAGPLDRETLATYNLTIQVTETTGAGLTATATATITIDNVNEGPTVNPGSFSVNENAPNGTVVGNATFTDPDGPGANWSIVSGNTGGAFAINAATGQITVANSAAVDWDTTPAFNLTVQVSDGGTPNLSDTEVITISVTPANDAPVNSVPGPQVTLEETALLFPGNLSVSDADATSLQVTLSVTNGTFSLSGIAGLSFSVGDGTADATMTFTGTIAAINAALNGSSYLPAVNYWGLAQLQIVSNDLGATGFGGPLTDTDTVQISVNSVNDAPVNTVPGAQVTNEDTPVTINGISIADVEAGAGLGTVQVTLATVNGTMTLGSTAGLSFIIGDGTADANLVFTGTVANVNAALAGLIYTPLPNYSGADQITLTTDDQGNSGNGGPMTDTDVIPITVTAVNDAPFNTVPGAQSVNEDSPLNLGSSIFISDADAGPADNLQVTLSATNGTLTLGSMVGLAFTIGDGTADATMTFTGTRAAINAAMTGLTFSPAPDYAGAAQITITTNDLGNTGGPAATDTDSIAVTVNPVNDAPVLTVPVSAMTNEDTPGVLNGISVADIDAGTGQVTISLSTTAGTTTLATTAGLSFTTGDGTADASMVFSGTLAAVNAALNGMTFTPAANVSGGSTFTISVNDNGNTGTGGALTDNDSFIIAINAVNDAPVNTVPATQTTPEDTPLAIGGVSIADVDVGPGDNVQVTLSTTNGTLTLGVTGGLAFTVGDGSADTTMTFTGTLASVNTALASLSFSPAANFSGTATITVATDDLGNTPAPNATDTDSFDVTVTAVNDAPVNTVPGAQIVGEDAPLTFAGTISVADLDAAGDTVEVTLGVTNGTLTLSGTTGLSFTAGDGTADATMVFTGTLTNVNAALNGLQYLPNANYFGADTLSITTSDLGNNGSGGAQTDNDTVAITVTSQNDAPVLAGTGTVGYTEGAPAVTLAPSLTITDVDSTNLSGASVTISGNAQLGADDLTWTLPAGITANDLVAGSGVVTFSGVASVADYQTLLRSVAYLSTSNNPSTAPRGIDFQVTDDLGATSNVASVQVNVTATNDAPAFTSVAVTAATEDAAYTYNVTTSDPDVGDTRTITAPTKPAWLTLVDNGDGTATLSGTPTNSDVGVHNV